MKKIIILDYVSDISCFAESNITIFSTGEKAYDDGNIRGHGYAVYRIISEIVDYNEIIFAQVTPQTNESAFIDILFNIAKTYVGAVINISCGYEKFSSKEKFDTAIKKFGKE